MANKKTRAMRRAEYLRQRNAMETQAKEALNRQAQTGRETVDSGKSALNDTPAGGVNQQICLIPLTSIVTEEYQRVLNMKNVAGIVRDFDPAKLGVLVVSRRRDGTYSILDGQHRLAALRRLGFTAANCIVLEGMTIQQEADYFRRQNENKQSLRIADTFNAAVWAEDEESVTIKAVMDRHGFRLGKSGQPMCVCAIGALQSIVRQFGVPVLELTLASIAAAWSRDATILRREMLAGLGEFWNRYAQKLTVAQFESRMRTKMPMEMYQELRRRTQGKATPCTAFNKSVRFTACTVLVDAYNKGLRTGSQNRLKLEWDMSGEA